MIDRLTIHNFKSIKHLDINCKRINIFIGEPNTGKTNILETIGFLSQINRANLKQYVRFESIIELFNDQTTDNEFNIICDDLTVKGHFKIDKLEITFFERENIGGTIRYGYKGSMESAGGRNDIKKLYDIFKFYIFKHMNNFPGRTTEYLATPHGDNLFQLILTNNEIKKLISDIFTNFGYRLIIEQPQRNLKYLKEEGDVFILFPYSLLSDTIQNLIFHLTAIHTNENSVIVFNEPEARAFPYYTKQLAESIGMDKKGNQYFISSHNPYFLTSILEKTKEEDIHINVTYIEKYETKIKQLTSEQKSDILDNVIDPFFNIKKYIKE